MSLEETLINEILPLVQKPARYLGTEWNAVRKDWEAVPVKMAFAFPDLYEVEDVSPGSAILYGLVNSKDDLLIGARFCSS